MVLVNQVGRRRVNGPPRGTERLDLPDAPETLPTDTHVVIAAHAARVRAPRALLSGAPIPEEGP
jgi:hypothetical protein